MLHNLTHGKRPFWAACLIGVLAVMLPFAVTAKDARAIITPHLFKQAQKNNHWKKAFANGKHAQVVFMAISPKTNPHNEIGTETHSFDQIILVVSGKGEAMLHNKKAKVGPGDMVLVPQGTPHNVVNKSKKSPLKIISIYSDMDVPAHALYKTKADEPKS